MKELIDEKTFILAMTGAAILLFVLGIVVFFVWGKKNKQASFAGAVLLLCGPALFVLWQIYAGIVKHFGLDSVKGLGINLLIFVAIGAALGVLLGLWQKRQRNIKDSADGTD